MDESFFWVNEIFSPCGLWLSCSGGNDVGVVVGRAKFVE